MEIHEAEAEITVITFFVELAFFFFFLDHQRYGTQKHHLLPQMLLSSFGLPGLHTDSLSRTDPWARGSSAGCPGAGNAGEGDHWSLKWCCSSSIFLTVLFSSCWTEFLITLKIKPKRSLKTGGPSVDHLHDGDVAQLVVLDWHAADAGSIPQCGTGFLSQSIFCADSLTVPVYPYVQSHA